MIGELRRRCSSVSQHFAGFMLPDTTGDQPMWQMTVSKPINVKIAWFLWIALFVVATTSSFSGHRRNVTHHYRAASEHWFQGQRLYGDDGDGFLYFPQAAILYSP